MYLFCFFVWSGLMSNILNKIPYYVKASCNFVFWLFLDVVSKLFFRDIWNLRKQQLRFRYLYKSKDGSKSIFDHFYEIILYQHFNAAQKVLDYSSRVWGVFASPWLFRNDMIRIWDFFYLTISMVFMWCNNYYVFFIVNITQRLFAKTVIIADVARFHVKNTSGFRLLFSNKRLPYLSVMITFLYFNP